MWHKGLPHLSKIPEPPPLDPKVARLASVRRLPRLGAPSTTPEAPAGGASSDRPTRSAKGRRAGGRARRRPPLGPSWP